MSDVRVKHTASQPGRWEGLGPGGPVCPFVSIQGHFPKEEGREISVPPVSDAVSADQRPSPSWIREEEEREKEREGKTVGG